MTESERNKQTASCFYNNSDINNLQTNFLKKHWAIFSNLSDAILKHVGHHFLTYRMPFYSMMDAISKQKKDRKNEKFCLTQHWPQLSYRWLEVTRHFLLLDSDSTWRSHDSSLTRLEKIVDDSDSTLTRRACDSDSTLTWQKWLGNITAVCCFSCTVKLG